ncbi:alpha amylase, catalytic domain protein, partial [Ostertagia ostertagi]
VSPPYEHIMITVNGDVPWYQPVSYKLISRSGNEEQFKEMVRNCRLDALADLNQGSPGVRKKLVAFLDRLIDYGVAGFRFDASKHMWPEDLRAILTATKNLRADIFGPNERPFVVHEVTDRGTFEIVTIDQYVTLGSWLANMGSGYGYGNFEDHDVLNFINNHDSQRDDDRWREAISAIPAVDNGEEAYTHSAFEYN